MNATCIACNNGRVITQGFPSKEPFFDCLSEFCVDWGSCKRIEVIRSKRAHIFGFTKQKKLEEISH